MVFGVVEWIEFGGIGGVFVSRVDVVDMIRFFMDRSFNLVFIRRCLVWVV